MTPIWVVVCRTRLILALARFDFGMAVFDKVSLLRLNGWWAGYVGGEIET